MYKNTCKYCNKEIIVEKQQAFSSHVAWCNPNKVNYIRKRKEDLKEINPINTYTLKCSRCGKDFELEIKKSYYERGEHKKTCSKFCATSKVWTEEQKKKVSNTAKNSEKVREANRINCLKQKINRKEKFKEKIVKEINIKDNKIKLKKIFVSDDPRKRFIDGYTFYVDICQYCNEEIIHKNPSIRKYHTDCWKKCSGGYREGSVKNFKSGTYKGYYCDSSWELAYIIYNLEHNIKFSRNTEGFPYFYDGNNHNYHPDYILEDGSYVEIKNYKSDLTEAKLANFPHKIKIMYKEDLEYIFNYVIGKYGKDYINLYDPTK